MVFDWLQFSVKGLLGSGTILDVPPEVLFELTFLLVISIKTITSVNIAL